MADTNNNTPPAAAFPAHAIAIVGLAGRFPGARDLDEFWQNVRGGVESLETFSDADLDAARVDERLRANPAYVRRGTVLDGVELFDAAFFGLAPREAQILDPQQRIFLECAWEALEHAGYSATSDAATVGVYGGQSMNLYLSQHVAHDPALVAAVGGYQLMLGNDKDFLCTRVSYKLDLRGPSVTIQTACSTSLVAVVMASRALARNECDIALAGGVGVSFPQRGGYLYQEGMILSPDARCRPFDVAAAGTRPGAGCGIVVLKRLADALADRDTVHAVIRGGAINNDGAGKAGFTAPSVDGQVEVIATAQALAGVAPRDIEYIEAHGTGTPLGDPIEIAALTQAFRASTDDVGFCRLGSLKANLGHLDIAAGVASLIKAVLVLKNRELPPLVNFTRPNPQLALESSPFFASAEAAPWHSSGAPRRAGVSAFGIGGTNAHVVLEEAPAIATAAASREAHLLLLSAKTPTALESMTTALGRHLAAHPNGSLEDIEWTLQVGRRAFAYRRALSVRDVAQAIEALAQPQRAPVLSAVHEAGSRPVAFLFSGQGSQFAGMGASLYGGEPVYRDAVDRCAALLEPHLGLDLRKVLFTGAESAQINETRLAQPALFVTEYALARLWSSWGVQPAAMLGHSIGELVAAHLAGVLSLSAVLQVVAARGRLMQALPAGSMAAVYLGADELKSRLSDGVEVAAINAPGLCTISGPTGALASVLKRLQAAGVETRPLHTSHAFHSSMMEPALAPFTRLLESIELSAPTIPYVSNVTGTWITPKEATSPEYYARHLRSAVSFEAGVRTLAADGAALLLEVGPGTVLTTLARLIVGKDGAKRVLQSIGRPQDDRNDAIILREAAGKLWLAGVSLDFAGMHAGSTPRRVPLPTYPFERKRHWVDAGAASVNTALATATAAPHSDRLEDWLFAPTWTRDDAPVDDATSLTGVWLVLGDDSELSRAVEEKVRAAGATPVRVERGLSFERKDASRFVVRAGSSEDIAAVADTLQKDGAAAGLASYPAGALHLWGVGDGALDAAGVYDALVGLGLGLGATAAAVVQVVHVATNSESVLDERIREPKDALALGPVLVLPAEMPNLRMRSVDLDILQTGLHAGAAAQAVLTEAAATDPTPQSARRRGRRWVKRYERIALPEPTAARLPLKSGGVYLITGALGGIGLTLARWLATEFKARLLLTARSGLPAREQWDSWLATHPPEERAATAIAAIRAMEAVGGEVSVAAADVADESAMAAAIGAAQKRWGRIDGVIHAAGVAGSGALAALKSAADTRATISPKVDGLGVLINLLGTTPLDFVALMSSTNSVLGSAGTCDYAAANAVLDAFASGSARPPAWRHVVAFNWSAWRDVGMAANLAVPPARREQWRALLAKAIPSKVGVEAFARGLASRRHRVIVASFDLLAASQWRQHAEPADTVAVAPGASTAAPATAGSEVQSRPDLSTAYDAPQTDIERRLAAIWSELLGVDRIGRHDDFFELGGHSLLATRVLARVQDSLGARLTLREVFDAPTVEKMSKRLAVAADGTTAAAAPAADEREEIEF